MDEVLLLQDEMKLLEASAPRSLSASKIAGSLTQELAASVYALEVLGPQKSHWRCKPPLDTTKIEVMGFPTSVPAWAEPVQLLFMHTIMVPAPPAQFEVVKLATDPCIPVQYNWLAKTTAASKGKQQVIPTEEDESDYGQLSSEAEEEEEEGKTPTQCFQHVQCNKKLAKKANKAQAAATLAYRCTDLALHNQTMQLLLSDPAYQDLINPIQRPEDMPLVECQHIPSCFLCTKKDGTTALHVMHTSDPKRAFDLNK
ncbi:hypothetical protein C0993_011327 [Termitomyces sp. T159_Od127]|nr:hypothetical protein C0993_011327 [Termitomyces sp. T159_Od127]